MSIPYIKNLEHINKRQRLADKCFNLCVDKAFHDKKNPNDSFIKQSMRFREFSWYYEPINNIKYA
tara:strand:+ start:8520 stop:8714 length:195 start_codon:yes stop_codon:yes gene_type:complete